MDFLKEFDARSAAEELIEVAIRDQVTGEAILNGKKPCIVLVKSFLCEEVLRADRAESSAATRSAFAKARKARKDGKPKEEEEKVSFDWDEIEERVNARAVRMIGGFKNLQTVGENGKSRSLTAKDAEAFVALNRISENHHWRKVLPLSQNGDESDEAFEARKERVSSEWLGASFAQQILDAAAEHAELLGKRAKT